MYNSSYGGVGRRVCIYRWQYLHILNGGAEAAWQWGSDLYINNKNLWKYVQNYKMALAVNGE